MDAPVCHPDSSAANGHETASGAVPCPFFAGRISGPLAGRAGRVGYRTWGIVKFAVRERTEYDRN